MTKKTYEKPSLELIDLRSTRTFATAVVSGGVGTTNLEFKGIWDNEVWN